MRKPYSYRDLDHSKRCECCNKPIKRNVLSRAINKVVHCFYCNLYFKKNIASVWNKILKNKKKYKDDLSW